MKFSLENCRKNQFFENQTSKYNFNSWIISLPLMCLRFHQDNHPQDIVNSNQMFHHMEKRSEPAIYADVI